MKDELGLKLQTWKVAPEVPASFQREVWQRIAARQADREEAAWPQMLRRLAVILVRPHLAAALSVVTFFAGVGLAHPQAQGERAKQLKLLEARYAASVDPLEMHGQP